MVGFAALLSARMSASAPANPEASIWIDLRDDAGVPAAVLAQARANVTGIFRTSRIEVVWFDGGNTRPESQRLVRVQIVASRPPGFASDVGGAARRSDDASVALVFFDQVSRSADYWCVKRSVVLGEVMAHELGHLLLPAGSHTLTGVMRATWGGREYSVAAQHPVGFSEDQARLMRVRLRGGKVGSLADSAR
jgi:hypothetical protein